jgi:hypothetical protein
MNIGTCVQFRVPNGSVGRIEALRNYDDGFYVRWYYGLDLRGAQITDRASIARRDLVEIPESTFYAYINQRAWTQDRATLGLL